MRKRFTHSFSVVEKCYTGVASVQACRLSARFLRFSIPCPPGAWCLVLFGSRFAQREVQLNQSGTALFASATRGEVTRVARTRAAADGGLIIKAGIERSGNLYVLVHTVNQEAMTRLSAPQPKQRSLVLSGCECAFLWVGHFTRTSSYTSVGMVSGCRHVPIHSET